MAACGRVPGLACRGTSGLAADGEGIRTGSARLPRLPDAASGAEPNLAALGSLTQADLRAWLAAQAGDGQINATRARHLSAVRSFYRYLARHHGVTNPAPGLLGTPKARPPDPEGADRGPRRAGWRRRSTSCRRTRPCRRGTRRCSPCCTAAACASPRRGPHDAPRPGAALRVVGKGAKERLVPVLPAVLQAVEAWLALHPDRQPDAPLFPGVRGKRLNAGGRAADDADLPRPRRPAGSCDAARATPLLRDASAGGRRGICARSRNCWAMRPCRPRSATRRSMRRSCCRSGGRRIRGPRRRKRRRASGTCKGALRQPHRGTMRTRLG